MTIPTIFGDTPDNILQSFTDAIAGRSMQLYYACSANGNYVLSRDVGTSYPLSLTMTTGAQPAEEMNFDLTINKVTTIAGIGFLDYYVSMVANSGATLTIRILHVSAGAVETQIASASNGFSMSSTNSGKIKLDITRTTFAIGTKLRMEVILDLAGDASTTLYFNPKVAGNELMVWIPVVNME